MSVAHRICVSSIDTHGLWRRADRVWRHSDLQLHRDVNCLPTSRTLDAIRSMCKTLVGKKWKRSHGM